jgi:hypothetical protein
MVVGMSLFCCRFSMDLSRFVGMCLAFNSGGLFNGIHYRPLISKGPDGPSNDDTGDLK